MLLTTGVSERQKLLKVAQTAGAEASCPRREETDLAPKWVEAEDFHHRVSLPELFSFSREYENVCGNHWRVERMQSSRCFCSFQPLPLDQESSGKGLVPLQPRPPFIFHGTVGGIHRTV